MGMTHTLSGNVLSFQTAEESNIASLKCNFSCNPNYHGFNGVWPGGVSKNKLGFKTANGVADGTSRVIDFTENYIKVTATSTVSGNAIIGYPTANDYCRNNIIPAGTYTFSIQDFSSNIPDFSKSNIRFITNHGQIFDGETFTFTENAEFMFIGYSTTFSWPKDAYIMFKLQLEEGSSATLWEPYENIATITGHNQIEVQHYGNNICNQDELEWYNGYRNDNGVYTTSANSHMVLTPINVKPLTKYYLKIASSHTNTRIYYLTKDEQWINRDYGRFGTDTINFITPENCYKIQIQFYHSDDVSSIHLQEARYMSKYEAYHENKYFANFPAVGKNLLDEKTYGISYDTSMCFGRTSNTYADNMFLKAGTYTVSSDLTADMIVVTTSTGQQLNGISMNTTYHTFTLTQDDNIGILFYKSSMTANEFLSYHYQLEEGSTVTSYEPFNNTIYGGYIDLATGQLVQTHKYILLNEPNEWTSGTRAFFYKNELNFFSDREIDNSGTGAIGTGNTYGLFCTIALANTTENFYCRWVSATNYNFALRYSSNLINPPTLEQIKTLASENKIGIIYKLAVPIYYQLTPQQLQTYIESNYFYSDDVDTIECTYEFNESADILATRKRIIASTPHIETISNGVASFITDRKALLKSCKIYFEPYRLGYDNASVSNPRDIQGWNEVKLWQYNGNVLNLNISNFPNSDTLTWDAERNIFSLHGELATNVNNLSATINDSLYFEQDKPYSLFWHIYGANAYVKAFGVSLKDNSNSTFNTIISRERVGFNNVQGFSTFNDSSHIATLINFAVMAGSKDINIKFVYTDASDTIDPYTFTWPNNQTIYGGYYDPISGDLVETVSVYETTWGEGTQATVLGNTERRVFTADYKIFAPITQVAVHYCNVAEEFSGNTADWNADRVQSLFGNNTMILKLPVGTSNDTPIKFIGTANTPIHYQLTPQPIITSRGNNNFWAATNGNIEIKYWTH